MPLKQVTRNPDKKGSIEELATQAKKIIARAEKAGVEIDDGNVVDLIADNSNASLIDIRTALVVASLASRFPKATSPNYWRKNPAALPKRMTTRSRAKIKTKSIKQQAGGTVNGWKKLYDIDNLYTVWQHKEGHYQITVGQKVPDTNAGYPNLDSLLKLKGLKKRVDRNPVRALKKQTMLGLALSVVKEDADKGDKDARAFLDFLYDNDITKPSEQNKYLQKYYRKNFPEQFKKNPVRPLKQGKYTIYTFVKGDKYYLTDQLTLNTEKKYAQTFKTQDDVVRAAKKIKGRTEYTFFRGLS